VPADVSAAQYVRPYDFDLVDFSTPQIHEVCGAAGDWLVVGDDSLLGGTKVRYLPALVNAMANDPEHDEIVFAGPAQGALPFALSVLYGPRAVLYYPQRRVLSARQRETLLYDARHVYSEPPYIRPSAVKKRAREYAQTHGALCIRWSLSYPEVVESIGRVAKLVEDEYGPFDEVWVAGGGGTLTRGICAGFSADTRVHCVGVGRSMLEHEVGRAVRHVEPFVSMDRRVKDADLPSFSIDPWYDAKAWVTANNGCSCHGIRASGHKLFWNVVAAPPRDLWP
jgi:hypothetical protein